VALIRFIFADRRRGRRVSADFRISQRHFLECRDALIKIPIAGNLASRRWVSGMSRDPNLMSSQSFAPQSLEPVLSRLSLVELDSRARVHVREKGQPYAAAIRSKRLVIRKISCPRHEFAIFRRDKRPKLRPAEKKGSSQALRARKESMLLQSAANNRASSSLSRELAREKKKGEHAISRDAIIGIKWSACINLSARGERPLRINRGAFVASSVSPPRDAYVFTK
jgi:hypothetical protein